MIYTPFGNAVLGTRPLVVEQVFMVIALSALPTFLLSGIKEIFNVRWHWQGPATATEFAEWMTEIANDSGVAAP